MSAAGGADRASRLAARWRGLSDVPKGFALAVTGIVILSPDALLIRLIEVDEGTLLFFRGAVAVIGYVILIRIHGGAPGDRRTWVLDQPELLMAGLFVIANVLFVTSIREVNVALALVIISSAPAFTALFSTFAGEAVAPRTWIACLVVVAGIGAIFALEPQGGHLLGATAALAASITIAVTFVVRRRNPNVRMLRSLSVGALGTAVVALPFASPGSISVVDLGLVLLMGLIVLPVSLDLIWRAPRYITAPEVSLASLMEAVLGPIWVWLVIHEAPTTAAVLGGAVILGTLATHALLTQRELAAARGP